MRGLDAPVQSWGCNVYVSWGRVRSGYCLVVKTVPPRGKQYLEFTSTDRSGMFLQWKGLVLEECRSRAIMDFAVEGKTIC
jgi:hypothetical protein